MLKFQLFFFTVTISKIKKDELVQQAQHDQLVKEIRSQIEERRNQYKIM